MKIPSNSIFLLPFLIAPVASAALMVDFTSPGSGGGANNGPLIFLSTDPSGTGVSFDITASAVIPAGGGANNGDIARNNGGLGSTVENTGAFLNVIGGVSEVIEFSIGNVVGLGAGESLQLTTLLSQNLSSQNANQTAGFGGTFGNVAQDSLTFTSDNASSIVINQSDAGDTGAILLAGNNGNNTNTGNTFRHFGTLDFASSFQVAQTDLTRNDAVLIQGFEFTVIPEPSTSLMVLGGFGLLLIRKRRA